MTRGRWTTIGVTAVVATAAWLQGQAMEQGEAHASRIAGVMVALHGDTPSMAWSPDSSRVAINASYTYFGHDEHIAAHRASLGVYVVDASTGEKVKVSTDQGYHPLWTDKKNVAWGHSVYEDGEAGLYTSVSTRAAPRRIGSMEGVNHTLLAKQGGILFYSGFPEEGGWSIVDKSGQVTSAGIDVGSWQIPSAHAKDQCPQSVGNVRITEGRSTEGARWSLQVGEQVHPISDQPYTFETWVDGASGLVRPCLSPDGTRIAYLETSTPGAFEMKITQVPQ